MKAPRKYVYRGLEMDPAGDGWQHTAGAVALRVYRPDPHGYWTADVYCGSHLLGWCQRETREKALDYAIGMAFEAADRRLREARTEHAAVRAIPVTGGHRG